MNDQQKYFPVNWIDGMKINKDHFIAQDNATIDSLQRVASLKLSPVRYGLLPASVAGENNFTITVTTDNQNTITVSVLNCKAVTSGGVFINIPSLPYQDNNGVISGSFTMAPSEATAFFYVVLTVHPFDRLPAGSPDLAE